MKNQILISAVVATFCVTASAKLSTASKAISNGSVKASKGSLEVSQGAAQLSAATLDVASGGIISSAENVSDVAGALARGSVIVINNSVDASSTVVKSTAKGSHASSVWAVTQSGQLVQISADGSLYLLGGSLDAVGSTLLTISDAVEVTVDGSGKLLSTSGAYIKDNSGRVAQLLVDGSGKVYTVSTDAVVVSVKASANGSSTVARVIDETSVDFVRVSATEAAELVSDSVVASAVSSRATSQAGSQSGKQYGADKKK